MVMPEPPTGRARVLQGAAAALRTALSACADLIVPPCCLVCRARVGAQLPQFRHGDQSRQRIDIVGRVEDIRVLVTRAGDLQGRHAAAFQGAAHDVAGGAHTGDNRWADGLEG